MEKTASPRRNTAFMFCCCLRTNEDFQGLFFFNLNDLNDIKGQECIEACLELGESLHVCLVGQLHSAVAGF